MECTTPRVYPNVNYGLWVMMMHQCRFIDSNKYTTLVWDVDGGRDGVAIGTIWELFVFSA